MIDGRFEAFVIFNFDKLKRKRVLAVRVGERKTIAYLILQKLSKHKS